MTNLNKSLYNSYFSHIYIEKDILEHPNTNKILSHYQNANIITINHYKDVFNRNRQGYHYQKQSPNIILAKKQGTLVYEGAPVCQSFGNRHFYYTSSVMNCIYDCEYCYLQGMYPSANLVIFVNLEDIFKEIALLLQKHPVYLCISYDTDLLALEHTLGYVKEWFLFAKNHPELTIELRTKSANITTINSLEPLKNVILAWTLSPDAIQQQYEHHTPTFYNRISAINNAMEKGHPIRLCFDPILYSKNWKQDYQLLFESTFSTISASSIQDVSVGVFRVSEGYLKQMRKQRQDSVILWYPYENDHGVFHYGKELSDEIIAYITMLLCNYVQEDKIFVWKEMI